MFCFHKWGEVIDNRQKCTKCGKISLVPCFHKWIEKDISYDNPKWWDNGKLRAYSGRRIRLQCEKCGDQEIRHLD